MKKIAILLISAILTMNCVNIYAQTETNTTEGCNFRFVLVSPIGFGWNTESGISVTVDGVDYGIITLPWGTPSAEETLPLPLGEVLFSWIGGTLVENLHYFEIFNSINELIYTSPEMHPVGLLFTYQNECNIGIASTTLSNQISVYPNPTSNELRITNYELRITAVEIFDFLGRRQCLNFVQQPKAEDTMVINISNLPNGIYFVMITTEKGRVTKKVIKQ
jgi:hypothetical protein